ncbi:Phosphatidylserine/phosphatidylglycerophosphate/cardiolinpin synthase -like protein [Brachionus plicatilis]|uniref:Phosphatidylserine/phosphatidylglycerophosphate/ cardiolinpin synthase-like protein n=1 Tax=Brachionus plicatilis TaxID=10195 RepID=A0A3M7RWM0_BRAPC|nr:Phosphatidylserine/phosphatidylglycerophosphate/cardiolinpin synthase -like protein [Brachionus plicatilis]
MKAITGIIALFCLSTVILGASIKQSPEDLLTDPAALAYIAQKLQENPEALQAVLFFLASNGVNLQALLAGDSSQLNDPSLVNKFKDFIQQNETLRAFVLDILNHFGIQIPRIDWGSIGSSILEAIPTVIDYAPTIISVISWLGKRDISFDNIHKNLLPNSVVLTLIAAFEGLKTSTTDLAIKIKQFLADNGVSVDILLDALRNGTYGQYLTASVIQKVKDWLSVNPDAANYFYDNFGDFISLLPQ